MPINPKTPGVYIQEIQSLPGSIAPVATAIPAFVGYTEKAVLNGESLANNTPVRIQSLLEYREIFGEAFDELFGVTIADPVAPATSPVVTISKPATLSPYLLYYQLQMFYANGGGPCYIISVGKYTETDPAPGDIDNTALLAGVKAVEKEDEPTILVVPEAVHLTPALRKGIYDAMLAQSAKLQDRVALMDVLETSSVSTIKVDGDNFRNNDVGPDNLKYGMAYYPSLKTSLERFYTEGSVLITDNRAAPVFDLDECTLNVLNDGSDFAIAKIIIDDNAVIDGDTITINGVPFIEGTTYVKAAGNATTAKALVTAIEGNADPAYSVSRSVNVIILKATKPGTPAPAIPITYTDSGTGAAVTIFSDGGTNFIRVPADTTLYASIKKEIKKLSALSLYPCGAMAGVYARVDRDRGVWKAPANVSLRNVREPGKMITSAEQEDLNVDATSGKSINAIRTFAGKGVMVWGARTLAGNDNEWRYVPVRRFFNFAEESIKKATEFVVFEPNDANTWVRVKGMIENFLTKLWRDGALAGAKPENAFFVKVGLGETMTSQDILDGIMNVEIGMAVVRPAEFIILRFSHKLQES
jgi:Bacteriophage tail sheath protein